MSAGWTRVSKAMLSCHWTIIPMIRYTLNMFNGLLVNQKIYKLAQPITVVKLSRIYFRGKRRLFWKSLNSSRRYIVEWPFPDSGEVISVVVVAFVWRLCRTRTSTPTGCVMGTRLADSAGHGRISPAAMVTRSMFVQSDHELSQKGLLMRPSSRGTVILWRGWHG